MTSKQYARRPVALIPLVINLLLTGCASAPQAQHRSSTLAELAWLSGFWRDTGEGGSATEEHWTPPAGGSMLGVSRSLRPAGDEADGSLATASYEFLRISAEPDGNVVYHASPQGRYPPTPFTLETKPGSDLGRRLVFTNPAHDFPQRIVYEKRGRDRVDVTISAIDDAEAPSMSWTFRRVRSSDVRAR
jgi:hypothetical protein